MEEGDKKDKRSQAIAMMLPQQWPEPSSLAPQRCCYYCPTHSGGAWWEGGGIPCCAGGGPTQVGLLQPPHLCLKQTSSTSVCITLWTFLEAFLPSSLPSSFLHFPLFPFSLRCSLLSFFTLPLSCLFFLMKKIPHS